MRRTHGAGTIRLAHTASLAAVALLAPGAPALAQQVGGAQPAKVMVTARDSSRRETEVLIMRQTSARIDSLVKRLNGLALGSAEYVATEDTLRAAFRELPHPTTATAATGGKYTIVATPRATLKYTVLDIVPSGWFGFQADGINRRWDEPTGSYVQYFEYPTVVSIEASSPALRAGMRTGDALIAYDGLDLRRNPINLTRLLTPGREVMVKLRRDGEAKDVLIAVDKAPPSLMAERRQSAAAEMVTTTALRGTLIVDSLERRMIEERVAVGRALATATSTTSPQAVRGTRPPAVAAATLAPSGVLGAAMTDVDVDLAKAIVGMDGKRGVLVTVVRPGSPAERTGLKSGDVILRVGANEVWSTAHLRARLQQAEMDGVEKVRLTVLRAGKTTDLLYDPR
jgi:hypothetical protein